MARRLRRSRRRRRRRIRPTTPRLLLPRRGNLPARTARERCDVVGLVLVVRLSVLEVVAVLTASSRSRGVDGHGRFGANGSSVGNSVNSRRRSRSSSGTGRGACIASPAAAATTCALGAAGLEDSSERCWRGAPSFEGEMRPAFLRWRLRAVLRPAAGTGIREGLVRLRARGEFTERARDTWPWAPCSAWSCGGPLASRHL
ncbi:hypothetical protein P171DRAFT_202115 [Karstenula rhodostoma CBS 690.94]|uniref:Uncharacterized protein n=1 Tax=Karstenula rhodostoma CBS 690.94 TaxID=1392251 RepID=A0A9P4PW62_9PLEO|nr:hypothetical protein P171DRAFT_202115 [Karstenula rhodostoma CBS 690.94]